MPTGAFNICCPRDCVFRHNGGTSGAPLKLLRDDSALSVPTCTLSPRQRTTYFYPLPAAKSVELLDFVVRIGVPEGVGCQLVRRRQVYCGQERLPNTTKKYQGKKYIFTELAKLLWIFFKFDIFLKKG